MNGGRRESVTMRRVRVGVTISDLWGSISEWFDDHPVLFLIGVTIGAISGILFFSLLWGGCPQRAYHGSYLKITSYKLDNVKWERTPKGIRVYGGSKDTYAEIDRRTDSLENCLRKNGLVKSIKRDWFAVYIPPDWYTSLCGTKEQLVPSRVSYLLCEKKKDPQGNPIKIPVVCRNVERPTKECPCPCNIRSGIQNSRARPVVVTTPNLKLFKMSLARIVLYPQYVLRDLNGTECLW